MTYLTTTQAAERLHVNRSRVIALIRAGRLKATKFGNAWQIDPRDLAAVKVRKVGYPKGRPRKRASLFAAPAPSASFRCGMRHRTTERDQ